MAETLKLKLDEFKKALATLEEALAAPKSTIVRDSAIKRFEYTFELAWKSAKVLLEERFGVQVFSPKECFRELRVNGLVSDEDDELLLQLTDDRNEVIHTYNEAFANELYEAIATRYAALLRNLYVVLMKTAVI